MPDPSWACGAAAGLPPPTDGELIFKATLQVADIYEVGKTPYGQRRIFDIAGGSFQGDRISGAVLAGGLEYELVLDNGSFELEQIIVMRSSDGVNLYMRTCGFAPNNAEVRFVPDIEVGNSSRHAWLNAGKFAGVRSVNSVDGTVELAVYDISALSPREPKIQLRDPPGVAHQPWECATGGGAIGAVILTENVTLGASVSVGASKRGNRNIIPITGGSFSGRLNGIVVPGGADYQLLGGSTVLDARYTLLTGDGEYILVRNCGAFGALLPRFETRTSGSYAWLNENRYLSSDPGVGGGGVSITFYERR